MQRMHEQLIGSRKLNHITAVHDADAIGELLDDGEVMRYEHDREAH